MQRCKSNDENLACRVVPSIKKPIFNCANSEMGLDKSAQYDVLILVGPPAIGKTTLTKLLEVSYDFHTVSLDECRTKSKFKKGFLELLNDKKHIVVDNNDYTGKARKEIMELIPQSSKVAAVLIHPTNNQREIAEYLNYKRCYETGKWISVIVYNTYYKNYCPPHIEEGFDILEYFIEYTEFDKYY